MATSQELMKNNQELKLIAEELLEGYEDNIRGLFILLDTQENCEKLTKFAQKHRDIITDKMLWEKAISLSGDI